MRGRPEGLLNRERNPMIKHMDAHDQALSRMSGGLKMGVLRHCHTRSTTVFEHFHSIRVIQWIDFDKMQLAPFSLKIGTRFGAPARRFEGQKVVKSFGQFI